MSSKNIIDFIMTSFYINFCPNTFALYFYLKQGNNIKWSTSKIPQKNSYKKILHTICYNKHKYVQNK